MKYIPVPQVLPTTAPGNFTYLEDCKEYVLTTFYPYQWDLNYQNPVVFNEMAYNLLYLANKGIDVIRIDAVPYIWKQLGTNCRNLPQVHNIVRMMRILIEIVCPGTLLLGEVVMEPKELAPYFGTANNPECHLLYNVTTMATLWHTVATKDIRLLKCQLDQLNKLPKDYNFLIASSSSRFLFSTFLKVYALIMILNSYNKSSGKAAINILKTSAGVIIAATTIIKTIA